MLNLFDRLRPGQPISKLGADWYNSVASWINRLRGEGVGCEVTITKPDNPSDSNPPLIRVVVPSGGGGSDIDLSDATPQKDSTSGDAGESEEAARGDHSHPINVDTENNPKPVAATASKGTSTKYARADHQHAGITSAGTTDTPSQVAPDADTANGAAGTHASRTYANADHKHKLNVGNGTLVGLRDVDGGDEGEEGVYARSDHQHILNAPGAQLENIAEGDYPADVEYDPDGELSSGIVGSSPRYARADHVHRCDGCGDGGGVAENPGVAVVDVSTGTTEPTSGKAGSWTAGGDGVKVTMVVGVYYDHTAATPKLAARVRDLTYDKNGRLYAVGAEGTYDIDQPILVTLSDD